MTMNPIANSNIKENLSVRFGRWRIQMLRQDIFVYYDTFFAGQYKKLQIRHGDKVLDAGAGFGDFSIIASAKVGDAGRVFAIEPSNLYYSLLQRNIEQNCLKNILPLKVALSNHEGSTVIEERTPRGPNPVLTPSTTMRNLVSKAGIGHFDVVKIDVEGFEQEIFEDVSWAKGVREIVMETHGATRGRVVTKLQELGFAITVFDGRSMMVNTLKSVLLHPAEFLLMETVSRFVAFGHAIAYPIRPPMIVAPSNDFLRIIHATRML